MESTVQKEALAAQVAALPIQVVRHVLWHFGDEVLGEDPGSFVAVLLIAIGRADSENFLKLSLVFESYANAHRAVSRHLEGLELLRDRAKAARS